MERRKHTRYRVEYVGSFSGERLSAPGAILDLSTAGCRARSATEFNQGEYLGVLIHVRRYETPFTWPPAVVRWSNNHEFGMECIQMNLDDQQRLRQLITQSSAAKVLRSEHGYLAEPE